MALIADFEYDIFISYSHVDNTTLSATEKGWIGMFYEHLKQLLDRRYGRMDTVKIWWDDKKLDGTKLFDESIKNGIENSAIMLVLNSPGYQQSKYCKQELECFHTKIQNDLIGSKVGDRSRIVQVLLNNIPFANWPPQLNGTTGFPFHDALEKEDFGDPVDTNSSVFINLMRELRDGLWQLINDFNNLRPVASESIEEGTEFTIYIGEVADTLRTCRKRIVTELDKKGFRVLTGIPPPDEVVAHEKATKHAIEKADLLVHLLDKYPGREIQGAPEIAYPQKQTEISLQSPKPQMIWVPSDTDLTSIEEMDYQRFILNLESGVNISKGYEFIRGSKSTLANQISDFADQLKVMQVDNSQGADKLSVLLDTHFNDQTYAFDLGKALLENNIQPFINPQEDNPRKNLELLESRIGQVKKLIFLYGRVSKEWILERMSAALQLIIARNYPIEDFLVYMAPPHKEPNDITINQKFLKINVVDNSNHLVLDQKVIANFLNILKSTDT